MSISKKAFASVIKQNFPHALPSDLGYFEIRNVNGEGWNRLYQLTDEGAVKAHNNQEYLSNAFPQWQSAFEEFDDVEALDADMNTYAKAHQVRVAVRSWRFESSLGHTRKHLQTP